MQIQRKLAALGLLISYCFAMFSTFYKSDSIYYKVINAIQQTIVTFMNLLVLLNIDRFCCCKKKKTTEEAKKEEDQENKTELDFNEQQKILVSSLSEVKSHIIKIKDLADQGNHDAQMLLPTLAEKIKEINKLLNIK